MGAFDGYYGGYGGAAALANEQPTRTLAINHRLISSKDLKCPS